MYVCISLCYLYVYNKTTEFLDILPYYKPIYDELLELTVEVIPNCVANLAS
jgi:hypothetical protein